MRSSRSGHKEHSTPQPGRPTHTPSLTTRRARYRSLPLPLRAADCRLPCRASALPCPAHAWPRLDWQLARWPARWLADGGKDRAGQGEVGGMDGCPLASHWGLAMGIRFDATRLQVPGTEMQVRTGDATAPKLGWKPRPRGFVRPLAAQGCTPDHCRPSVSSISTLRNTHPISRLACF